MAYKNALADLPLGGGKAVLNLPAAPFDRRRLFHAFGRAVAEARGRLRHSGGRRHHRGRHAGGQ
jgi:glutamate dehydrogenase/leucine dehydrogenase